MIRLNEKLPFIKKCSYKTAISNQISISQITDIKYILNMKYFLKLILNFFLYRNLLRPDFLYSLVYSNFFKDQMSWVGIKIKIKCLKTKIKHEVMTGTNY